MRTALIDELEYRRNQGQYPKTIDQIKRALDALGYEIDNNSKCYASARWLSGDRAGKSYPCVTVSAREKDTKLSFANVNARRDDNFKALQTMRLSGEWYAISRGHILEI